MPLFFAFGVAIGFLLGGLTLGPGGFRRIIASGVIGLTCGSLALGIELIAYRPLSRIPDRWAAVARAPIFALTGIGGYLLGRQISFVLLFPGSRAGSTSRTLLAMLVMCALIGMVIGLSMFVYHTLKGRLQASVERLKEAEFAERELGIARAMQKRLLPDGELSGDGWRIVAVNDEAAFVAGDYYDVFPLGDEEIGIVVADVAGKGVGASLIMATAKALLPMIAPGRLPGEALSILSERLSRDLSSREFVAIAFARLNIRKNELVLANAGLPDPLLVRENGVEELVVEGTRLPAGLRNGTNYQSKTIALQPGDRILLFSDGLPEATDAVTGEPIGYERVREIAADATGDLTTWVESVRGAAHATPDAALTDDLTILALEIDALREASAAADLRPAVRLVPESAV